MKRIASFILVLLLLSSISSIPAFADEKTVEYGGVRYTLTTQPDKSGTIPVRVENSHVYADAEYMGALLGFNTIKNTDTLVFQNIENTKLVCFYVGTNKVEALNYIYSVLEYTAPFETIVEDSRFWVPLEFALSVLDSSILFENEEILITPMPETVMSAVWKVHKNNQKYNFDFEDDFGYSEEIQRILGASNRLVSEYNELLHFNPEAALDSFLNVFGISNVYDNKYGEDLAKLFVINSDEEFEAMNEDIDRLTDVLSPNGKFRELFDSIEDWEVSNASELANKYLDLIKNGNASNLELNAAYKQFEQALDSEKSFLDSAAPFKKFQDTLAKDSHQALDIIDQIFDVIQYSSEYQNKDQFALDALKNYYDQGMKEDYIPEQIVKTFDSVIKDLESSIGEYTLKNFLTNDLMEELVDSTVNETIKNKIGAKVSTALVVWNIVSEYVPCLKESLDGADKFILATYSQIFQSDSYRLLNFDSTTSDNELYQVAQAYYTYLKFCYVTRQSALATIEAQKYVDSESYEKLKQYQLDINKEIADLLAVFKSARINADGTINNDNRIYGYLPGDNEKYLEKTSDENLLVITNNTEKHPSEDELKKILQQNTSEKIVDFRYDDFDNNGIYEAFATTGNDSTTKVGNHVWFVYENGANIIMDSEYYQAVQVTKCSLKDVLSIGSENFIVVNTFYQSGGYSYLFKVDESQAIKMEYLVGDDIRLENENQISLCDEVYDGAIDGSGKTFKRYYFYWDENSNSFKEYGGIRVTENQLSNVEGGLEILSQIKSAGNTVTDIFYRGNGYININYTDGFLNNNATLLYKDGKVALEKVITGDAGDDLLNSSFGGVYKAALCPEIATYPENFPE